MALLWLLIYLADEVFGFLFGLHERNGRLDIRAARAVLDSLDNFPFDRPGPDSRKVRSAAELMAAFLQLRFIIDSKV
jgi:hypothetical protein